MKVTATAYLGSIVKTDYNGTAQMAVSFKNASGQIFSALTLGPLGSFGVPPSLSQQQQIALVPPGTTRITVTLTLTSFNGGFGGADSVSLVLNQLGTNPSAVLGTNLVTNGNAEAGPAVAVPAFALYIPGWSTNELASVAPYGGKPGIQLTDPGPADRGVNLFCGLIEASIMYQDIDVSPAATLIDSGQVVYQVSAWLGGYSNSASPTLAPAGPPVISPGGIVSASAFGGFTSVSPGSWIEIYGSDLAPAEAAWTIANGVAPTNVGGTTVSVGGEAAFIDYVSPGQIDALISSDTPSGAQPLTITTANGTSDKFYLIVNPTQPGLLAPSSFVIGGKQYVAALFPDNVTFALPANALPGVPSRPATAGDVLTIYGVGFGPVSGGFTAGTIVTQQNTLSTPIKFSLGTTAATLSYEGLAPSLTGLYQFNLVVPKVAANSATPISFTLGGAKGTQTLYIATQ